jgi:hypothetical protein
VPEAQDAQPEDVTYYATDCEALLDYAFSAYLGRNDACSLIIEERLLHRLSIPEKIGLLKDLLERHEMTWAPYDALSQELTKLFGYRNNISHSSPFRGDRFHRVLRRRGTNDMFDTTRDEVVEFVDRGMPPA